MKRRSKFILIFLVLILVGGFIYFKSLKTRHQELIKSKVFYTLGIVDSEWKTELTDNSVTFTSPTFVISNIYKSMEGPKSDQYLMIDDSKEELLWLTSFKTNAVSSDEQRKMSNDFVCHTNFEYRDAEHYNRWNMTERINSQYPRITSISNGVEAFDLPDGFGFPVFSNERLFINAQALNHNITDSTFNIKHKIKIGFTKNSDKTLIPLQPKTVFMMFPYDPQNPFEGPTEMLPNACIPVETKNHSYLDNDGNALSGHWIITPGKHSYSYDTSQQLQIKDSIRLHQITSHLHPFADRFKLKDKTTGEVIYDCKSENFTDKIGLKNTPSFSNQKGIWMYKDHTYEMLLEVDNITDKDQEMMASMAIFYYDADMDHKIKELKL
ncbi:hypothetical protein [Psychroserpens luteus]|uniref:Uncharacterized protein n=1 Tax=Psychroserpens luteus TaxID=1434066 RepID=A0ABW5ZZS5_9FLAO|nr:hypothetical protein [Psychroserpens luteus]